MNVDYEKVWMSIPLPSVVLNGDDIVVQVNPPGEGFLNASSKSLKNKRIWDLIEIDASLEDSYKKVKKFHSPLFITMLKLELTDEIRSVVIYRLLQSLVLKIVLSY